MEIDGRGRYKTIIVQPRSPERPAAVRPL